MGSSSPSSPDFAPQDGRRKVFDEIRQSWVKATPEELVRQQWLRRMVGQLLYPRELLVVEKQLRELPHLCGSEVPDRRLDILCYGKSESSSPPLFPLLLIECKDERLTEDAVNQVIGYNHHVRACFVAAVNLSEARMGCYDAQKNKYMFCSFLPSFKELMQWVKR
ncbi:MAG: type I restriction enzyme HsdR N-terminal domain-containing protein [Verrucomicrobia bacterium]|nr:type I restriction enzyme HsdR N-terminal domain-containing protein [Verrucomicrobiota bacterium]